MWVDLCKIIFTIPKNNFNFNFNFLKEKGLLLHNPFGIMVETPEDTQNGVSTRFY